MKWNSNFWDWLESYLDHSYESDALFFETTKQGLTEILESVNKDPDPD